MPQTRSVWHCWRRTATTVLAGLEATARNLELVEWKISFYKERLGRA